MLSAVDRRKTGNDLYDLYKKGMLSESLSKEIKSLNVQAFMTSTEESDFMTFNENSYIINLDNTKDGKLYEY